MGINERRLQKERIIGEMSYSMFDANGNTKPEWDWFMTLGVDHFKGMAADYPNKRVVVVAGAPKKDIVMAVLKGKMCNVLITDDATAEGLLNALSPSF